MLVPLLALLPLYVYHARNSPYLMWWGRRFVSTVIIGMVILIAFGVAWLATKWLPRRLARPVRAACWSGRSSAGVLALFMVAPT